MSDGCPFRAGRLSAASRSIPLGTWVRVRNLENGRSVTLPVRDRGPYIAGRAIDLSQAAAKRLGYLSKGLARVAVKRVPHHRRLPCD